MTIYLGADHRGFSLKEKIQIFLEKRGFSIIDLGAATYNKKDDYTDFAKRVASSVAQKPRSSRGILVCGSGVGMDIAANKVKGIRAALVTSVGQAKASRRDDAANVLVLAADFTQAPLAQRIVSAWLAAPFSAKPRYVRRLRKIARLKP